MADKLYTIQDGKLTVNFHQGQTRAWESELPIVAIMAGRQSGKTSFSPFWLYREILRTAKSGQGNSYLAVSASNDLFHVAFLPAMIEIFCDVLGIGYYWSSRRTMEIKCLDPDNPRYGEFFQGPTGNASGTMWARVILRSAQSEGSLESVTALAAVLDEAGQDAFTMQDWEAVQGRVAIARSQGFGRILITTTPYSISSFLYDLYIQWTNGDKSIDFIQFPSYYNPNFSREEYERQKASMPEWRAAMFLDGQFQRPAGLIYRDFNEATMLEDDFNPPKHWERVVGVDFGGANLGVVFCALDPYRNIWVAYDELLMGHMSTSDYVREVQSRLDGCEKYTVVGGAKSEGQFRRDWSDAGLYVSEPLVYELENGIARVIKLFKENRFHICRRCERMRFELRNYRRVLDERNNPTEQIMNKNSFHLLDSARYSATYMADDPIEVISMSYSQFMRKYNGSKVTV